MDLFETLSDRIERAPHLPDDLQSRLRTEVGRDVDHVSVRVMKELDVSLAQVPYKAGQPHRDIFVYRNGMKLRHHIWSRPSDRDPVRGVYVFMVDGLSGEMRFETLEEAVQTLVEAQPNVSDMSRGTIPVPIRVLWKQARKRHRRNAYLLLYRDRVLNLLQQKPPMREGRHCTNHDRAIWDVDPSLLVALRRYRWLGEIPTGRHAWLEQVLRNDISGALNHRSGSLWSRSENGVPAYVLVLDYLRTNWWRRRLWGSSENVERVKRRKGRFNYYNFCGLSSAQGQLDMIGRLMTT